MLEFQPCRASPKNRCIKVGRSKILGQEVREEGARRQGAGEQVRGLRVVAQMYGLGGARRILAAPSDNVSFDVQVFSLLRETAACARRHQCPIYLPS